ncbi:putative nuclease HARBI1 [Cydia splendana]|uniref:putative nuclease HARBI1 n=1 Tax=Cydia splendana TaxID=1100963 RepID=UPI00300D9EAA
MEDALNYTFDENNVLDDYEDIERILRAPRVFQIRRSYFEEYDERAFSTRFRLCKRSALELLTLVERKLEYPSDRNNSLSPINQLLLTLRYYATASHQLTMGDFAGVSRPTANRVIHRVTAALASLSKDFIRFPETPEDIRETQMEFYNIAKFPKVIGALDCTHIKIISPGGNHAETFRNRKGYMSINVQAVCNARLIITDLVARWPGSAHDERIFSASRRNAIFEMGTYNDSLLVADSGYMNRSYLMMPLDRTQTNEEASYNESQIRTRNPIERLFGIWKRRFPVLALGMHVHLKNCLPIIVATAVLHNILQSKGEECPPDDPELELPTPWDAIIEQGRIREQRSLGNARDINPVRRRLINNYFKTLHYL